MARNKQQSHSDRCKIPSDSDRLWYTALGGDLGAIVGPPDQMVTDAI